MHDTFTNTHRVSWKDITGSVHAPLLANVCQNGVASDKASVCQARPNSPDTGLVNRPDEIWSAAANTWLLTENPAMWTTSCMRYPAAYPLPYWIWIGWERFFSVNDNVALRRAILEQPDVQVVSATERSLCEYHRASAI